MSIITKDAEGKPFKLLSDYLRANDALYKFISNISKSYVHFSVRRFNQDAINYGFYWGTSPEGADYWLDVHNHRPESLYNDLMWILDVTKEEALKDPRVTGKPIDMLDELYLQLPLRITL